jgi:hypothetical protein
MIERLLEYVSQSTADSLMAITLEDAAICVASIRTSAGAHTPLQQSVNDRIELWRSQLTHERRDDQGQRTQPILRYYIDSLKQNAIHKLKSDELAFLVSAFELASNARDTQIFERVKALISPFMGELTSRLASAAARPGMPSFAKRIVYVTEREISSSKLRAVRSLAGIDLSFTGPVYSCKGLLKVIGSVPLGALVHAEDGSCIVCGFVLGIVCATQHCQISDNVSGTVVVKSGEVRCRNLVDKSLVIAKTGSVHCRRAMDPKLVFAGKVIRITDTSLGGVYKSKVVDVANGVVGGEFHVTERLTAKEFRPTDARQCQIVLRSQLTCEDFGEVLGRDAIRMLSFANRLKRKHDLLDTMIKNMQRENEQVAQAALLVICGGDMHVDLMSNLEKAERRVNLLNRVLGASQSLLVTAEEGQDKDTSQRDDVHADGHPATDSEDETLRELFADIEQTHAEFGSSDSTHEDELEALRNYQHLLGEKVKDRKSSLTAVQDLRDRIAHWSTERDEILTRIDQMLAELTALMGRLSMLDRFGQKAAKTDILRGVVQAIVGSSGNELLKERLGNPYVRYAITGVVKKTERIERYKTDVAAVKADLVRAAERLEKEFLVKLDLGDRTAGALVTGYFEPGVVITGDFPAGGSSKDEKQKKIAVTKAGPATYQRIGNSGIEQAPGA